MLLLKNPLNYFYNMLMLAKSFKCNLEYNLVFFASWEITFYLDTDTPIFKRVSLLLLDQTLTTCVKMIKPKLWSCILQKHFFSLTCYSCNTLIKIATATTVFLHAYQHNISLESRTKNMTTSSTKYPLRSFIAGGYWGSLKPIYGMFYFSLLQQWISVIS